MLEHRQRTFVSVSDYLEGELHADVKHEYIDGDVYAMAGGSRNHNTLTFNLTTLIGARLQPPCRGYGSDMKVRIKQGGREIFYYPDLSVSCEDESTDDYYNESPVLIIEVMSPSTERNDKYEKFLAYRALESLQEYGLVNQDIKEVWLFRRASQWGKEVYTKGEIRLDSLGITLSMDAIYRNVGL